MDDAFLYKDNLFIVVDGAGDQHYGALERERTCQVIHRSFFSKLPEVQSPGKALVFALQEANKEMFRESLKMNSFLLDDSLYREISIANKNN